MDLLKLCAAIVNDLPLSECSASPSSLLQQATTMRQESQRLNHVTSTLAQITWALRDQNGVTRGPVEKRARWLGHERARVFGDQRAGK